MRIAFIEVLLLIGSVSLSLEIEARPIVGAIRWDAWTGGGVTEQVERTLGPKKYHDRLPWFAEVIGDDVVRIDGSPQETMYQEIDFAADAGMDYWAFLLYPESSSMSTAIKQYLRSPKRKRINFCVILHNGFGVSDEQWPNERERAVALMKEPGYQTVLYGRPLVYAFDVRFHGAFPTDRFGDFLDAAHKAGLKPYCVFMGWNPARDFNTESSKGFDAVSAYAYGSAQATFAQLAQSVENDYWQKAAKANAPYVPLVTTGWDKQPRKENPVSWEKDHGYHRQNVFPATATPKEIASHLNRAITFVHEHPKICVANAIIIYAWNEHDEGGWLAPTWTQDGRPNTDRLDAIRRILKADNRTAQPAEAH
jgi:hypothetical protein